MQDSETLPLIPRKKCRSLLEEVLYQIRHFRLPLLHLKYPSNRQLVLLLLSCPALLDAFSYGVLSLSEILTTTSSLKIINNAEEIPSAGILPLMILPFFAACGVFILANKENLHRVKEDFRFSNFNISKKLYKAKKLIVNSPLTTLCLTFSAFAEAIIVFNNFRSSIAELGFKFSNHYFSTVLAINIAFQFLILNAKPLTNFMKNGYSVGDYLSNNQGKLERFIMMLFVNTLPILCSATVGILAASESYQFTDFVMRKLDYEDIAARIAWLPAFILGVMYFTCHFALYAPEFKLFLAAVCSEINKNGWAKYLKTFYPSKDKWVLKILLYPIVILISLSAFCVGFGGLDEMSYIIAYSESPTLQSHSATLLTQLLLFTVPAFSFCLGTYIVEARKLLISANLVQEAVLQHSSRKTNSTVYSLDHFVPDVCWVVLIGAVKFLVDWVYMPDSVTASQLTFTDSFLVASILGLLAIGRFGILSYYHYLQKNENKGTINQTEDIPTPRQFIIRLVSIWTLTSFFCLTAELITRYIFLDQSKTEEAMDRLNNAQVIGAISGGITSVYGLPAANGLIKAGKKVCQNCYSFFSKDKNTGFNECANEEQFTRVAQTLRQI